jgi:hypothetical protein
MSYYYPEIKIAANHNNQAGLVSIESIIALPPAMTPVPLGIKTITGAGTPRFDGAKNILWRWGFMSMTDMNTLVTTYIGGWTTAYGNVTIRTIKRAPANGLLTYGNFNAVMHLPVPDDEFGGGDYVQATTDTVTDLRWKLTDLIEI